MIKPNVLTGLIFTLILIIAKSQYSVAQITLEDSLVAYYPFNGNAIDESGNGNDGTVLGATLIADRNLMPNSAYSFDGIDDRIEIQEDFDFEKRSIVAWFYVRNLITGGPLFIFNTDNITLQHGNTHMRVWDLNGINTLQLSTGGGQALVEIEFQLNTWYMASIVVASDSNYYYLNDSLIGVKSAENLTQTFPWYGSRIGCRANDGNFFDGIIDDVLIYNRALSESEIDSIYNGSVILDIETEKTIETKIKVYPNPSEDYINVEIDQSYKDVPYQLTTIDGKVVMSGILMKDKNQIKLENIPAAMYLLNLELKGKKEIIKVFKKYSK